MSSVVLSGDTSGSVTLAAPAVAGSNTITLPARTGNVAVDGPAFSAYQSSSQSLTLNTVTKIQFQTKEFDTAAAFDATTNYRFTPQVAGYYQINAAMDSSGSRTYYIVHLYKNGSAYKLSNAGNGTTGVGGALSCLVYLNGSTDYIEIYGLTGVSQSLLASSTDTYFQAFLARAA